MSITGTHNNSHFAKLLRDAIFLGNSVRNCTSKERMDKKTLRIKIGGPKQECNNLTHTVNFMFSSLRDVQVKLFKEKLYLYRASREVFQVEVSLYLGQDR